MRARSVIGLVLLTFCILCRMSPAVADFYASSLYPFISGGLSWLGSWARVSLEEIVVLCFAAALIIVLVRAIRRKKGFFSVLGKAAMVVLWCLVWFYMGWGNNYYRTGLYQRCGIQRVSYEPETFKRFLDEYARGLNSAAEAAGSYDRDALEVEIKDFYSETISAYGYTRLHRWQHVKKPVFNALFSAVLVQGYMGPFFGEAQVNRDALEYEYPYNAAHELAHLAGVTSEAEASWWGFAFCRESANVAVRYSGYLSVLPYVVSNAGALLPEDEFEAWTATLCEKAKADYNESRAYWKEKKVDWIEKAQNGFYNLYLKSNGVSEGVKDYFGVVSMIMTMDAHRATHLDP